MPWSAPQVVDAHARDTDAPVILTRSPGNAVPTLTASSSANTNSLSDAAVIDVDPHPVADTQTYPRVVDTNTNIYPAVNIQLRAYPGGSHAEHESGSYLEGVQVVGGALPSSAPPMSGATSPVSLRSPGRSTVVSPMRFTATMSPPRSVVAVPPMGSLPTSPTSSVLTPTFPSPSHATPSPTSPSHVAPVPFPSTEESEYYASDDASDFATHYANLRRDEDVGGYDTPTLYTGTTNTSPTLSVTRVAPGEAPPALRLGPGMGFAGVGTYAGGGSVQGGVYVGGGAAGPSAGAREGAGTLVSSPTSMSAVRPMTADSGVSGFGRMDAEKDG